MSPEGAPRLDGSTTNDSTVVPEAGSPSPEGSDPGHSPASEGGSPGPDGSRDGDSADADGGSADGDSVDAGSGSMNEGGSPDDSGPDGSDASIEVAGNPTGQPCAMDVDCASGWCGAGSLCVAAASCSALLGTKPGLRNREYEIDPDGPGVGLPPFVAYCDMTTDGGGWTMLPLRFADPNYWSITQAGQACVKIDIQDNSGDFRQYQSQTDSAFAYTYMEFVPPIAATAARFVDFHYTNGGASNTMDFEIGGLPSLMNTSFEGWYFADPSAPQTPVGFTFPTLASCQPPYDVEYGNLTCSRDDALNPDGGPKDLFFQSATISFSATVTHFDMGLIQGCPSYPVDPFIPVAQGEQFHAVNPPAADGVWLTGIAVR